MSRSLIEYPQILFDFHWIFLSHEIFMIFNPISFSSNFVSDESSVRQILSELQLKKKIKAMENNLNAFTRMQGDKENIMVVKQMPKVSLKKVKVKYFNSSSG